MPGGAIPDGGLVAGEAGAIGTRTSRGALAVFSRGAESPSTEGSATLTDAGGDDVLSPRLIRTGDAAGAFSIDNCAVGAFGKGDFCPAPGGGCF